MTVFEARDGKEALTRFAGEKPDLIILDIGMPEFDGLDVCREIRRSSDIPILFLSARDDEIDRVLGLEIGGDDYVTKPFSPRELVARVNVILRRMASRGPDAKGIGGSAFPGQAFRRCRTAYRRVRRHADSPDRYRIRNSANVPDKAHGGLQPRADHECRLSIQHSGIGPHHRQPYPQYPLQAFRGELRQCHRNHSRRRFQARAMRAAGMTGRASEKWRPSVGLVIFAVLAAVGALPLVGLFFFRLYDNQLIHQTQAELIAQSRVLAAVYAREVEARLGAGIVLGAEIPPEARPDRGRPTDADPARARSCGRRRSAPPAAERASRERACLTSLCRDRCAVDADHPGNAESHAGRIPDPRSPRRRDRRPRRGRPIARPYRGGGHGAAGTIPGGACEFASPTSLRLRSTRSAAASASTYFRRCR